MRVLKGREGEWDTDENALMVYDLTAYYLAFSGSDGGLHSVAMLTQS